ncbi:acetyl-CoA carboxylase biotin carboxyl carrier protein [Brevibacillus sp. TJ4]|uniref:acetyl-CoA carboxylase biotin carboxyl carrier protein n=1 Tax=Brevibacillus sp. TJ4 TaxID=3234853 RepID=UPI0037D2B56D
MLNIYEIRELVKLLEQTDVESVEVKNETSRLSIKRRTAHSAVPLLPAPLAERNGQHQAAVVQITSKQAGTALQEKSVTHPVAAEPAGTTKPSGSKTEKRHTITSPMVGTFYRAPAVDAPPYVQVHDRVEESTVVCIVEAMKLFNEIEAEVRGEIVEILAENGQLVEPGQPLFTVKLDG